MKFLVVRNIESPQSASPRVVHPSIEEAMEEADRLCKKEKDCFYIVQIVAKAEPCWSTMFSMEPVSEGEPDGE